MLSKRGKKEWLLNSLPGKIGKLPSKSNKKRKLRDRGLLRSGLRREELPGPELNLLRIRRSQRFLKKDSDLCTSKSQKRRLPLLLPLFTRKDLKLLK